MPGSTAPSWFALREDDIPDGWPDDAKQAARADNPYQRYLLAQGDYGRARSYLDQAEAELAKETPAGDARAASYGRMAQAAAMIAQGTEIELPRTRATTDSRGLPAGADAEPQDARRRGSWER